MAQPLPIDQLPGFIRGLAREMDAAGRIAGDEALKTARAWVITYARNRKELQPRRITKALKNIKPRRSAHFRDMRWVLRVLPIEVPMAAYPHSAVPGIGGGVRAEINKGQPELVKHAFLATVKGVSKAGEVSLHQRIFVRDGTKHSLPIRQLFTSSVADVLHDGLVHREIQERAKEVYAETFARMMENGVAKSLAVKWAAKRR